MTAFVEKQTKMTNPLDDSTRLNRDIYVSASMQLINRDRPEDQKTFEVPSTMDNGMRIYLANSPEGI